MATLTITAEDGEATGTGAARVTAELTDADGNPVNGRTTSNVIVEKVSTVTNASGVATLNLTPNANITPANTYYTIKIVRPSDRVAREFLIEKGSGSETLVAAEAASPVALDQIQRVLITSAAGSDELEYDDSTTRWVNVDSFAKHASHQGAQHTPASRGWDNALDLVKQGTRRARVLLVADSVHELTFLQATTAFERLGKELTGEQQGYWWAPFNGLVAWPVMDGSAGSYGPDRRGALLAVGDNAGTTGLPVRFRYLRIYYEAHTSGCDLEVYIDGTLVDTIDTSLLSDQATSAAGDTEGQVWTSDLLSDSTHTFYVTAAGTGTGRVEGASLLPVAGFEVIGGGLSGQSTGEAVSAGKLQAFVEGRVADSEPPDLIVYHSDTADNLAASTIVSDVTGLDDALRGASVAPDASAAYVIPYKHTNTYSSTWESTVVPALRRMCVSQGFIPIDLFASMGDLTSGNDPYTYSSDNIHLVAKGARVMWATIYDALATRHNKADQGVLYDVLDRAALLGSEWRAVIDDDLINGGASSLGDQWTLTTNGTASCTRVATSDTYPHYVGVYHLGATGANSYIIANNDSLWTTLGTDAQATIEFWLRFANAQSAGEQYTAAWGWDLSALGQGARFVVDYANANYRAYLDTASEAGVYADTGVAVDTAWHRFKIQLTGGAAVYSIDGTKVAELPLTSSLGLCRPEVYMWKTLGSAGAVLKFDRFIHRVRVPFSAS